MTIDSLFDKQKIKDLLNAKVQEQMHVVKEELANDILDVISVTEAENVLEGDSLDGCDHCEIDTDETEDELKEQRIVYRVTSQGKRIKRIKCPPGRRVVIVNGVKKCVATTGTQKAKKRLATIKMQRTRRSKGNGYKKKIIRKQVRALRKRKMMGLNVGRGNR